MQSTKVVWKHIRRSPYQSLVAILTMFLTLLLAGVFLLMVAASALVLQFFESKPQITVFFSERAGQKEITEMQESLKATGKTASLKYISKEDALAIYREQNKNDPLLLEMVTADILPASLEVSANDPKFLPELAQLTQKANGVEEVVYQKDVVDMLLTWTNAIRLIGGGLTLLFALNALLITTTVIGMKIAFKREEIEVLKLVGASRWYIRTPFILEGGLYGLSGAVLATLVIGGFLLWVRPYLLSFLGVVPTISLILASPTSQVFLLSLAGFGAILTISGFLLGGLGSLVALGRYLKF